MDTKRPSNGLCIRESSGGLFIVLLARGKKWPNEMGFNETLTIKHTFIIMDGGSMNILVDFVAV